MKSLFLAKKKLKDVSLLELTPLRKYDYRINDKGLVDILLPRFKNKWLQKLLLKKRSPYFILHLDEIGTTVWLAIDGQNNVQQLCDILKNKYNEKLMSVEERTAKFIITLYQNGYLDFVELRKI